MSGRLYLVGTPIGNLGDITLRAIETLKQVERIYAEDTRRTRMLLSHLGIEGKKLIALHAHSDERVVATAVEILQSGLDIALVTDAGMPSVSDPGDILVRAAREAELPVTVIPGPSAVTTAIAASGLSSAGFFFLGFLPRKGKKRSEALQMLAHSPVAVVLFESPHRIAETLVDLEKACGPRTIAICRELTKKFEEVQLVSLSEAAREDFRETWLGELTLVLAPATSPSPENPEEFDIDSQIQQLLLEGHSVREISQELSRRLQLAHIKLSRRDVYARVLQLSQEDPTPSD